VTAEQLGQATLELIVDDQQLKDGLDKAKVTIDKSLKDLGDQMTKTGKTLSKTLTLPIMAAFTLSVKGAAEQEEAMALLSNAIRTTGNEGKVSADSLAKFASELQNTTRFGDEATLGAFALLESLTGLDEEGLKALMPRIQDFATVAEMDLTSAVRLVANVASGATDSLGRFGRAVEDGALPTERLSQLVGALDSKFAGAAATMGQTGLGPLVMLKNAVGDLGETFGAVLLPHISKLADFLTSVAKRLQEMDPGMREFIVTVALAAAAIGPLLLIGGKLVSAIAALIPVIKAVGIAFNFLTASPMGLIIAGVAALAMGVYLLIKNWDAVVAFFKDLWEKVVGFFKNAWEWIKEIIAKLWQWIKDHMEWILMAINPLAGVVALIIKNWDAISAFFKKLWADVLGFFKSNIDAIIGFVKQLYEGVKLWLVDKFMGIINSVKEALNKVTGFFKDLFNTVVGRSIIPDLVDGVIDEFERMQASVQSITGAIMNSVVDVISDAMFTLGESIVEGASAWDDFKESAKSAIVAVLKMIGKELLIYAIKSAIPIPGVFNPLAAALAGAGAVAAFAAAGAINAFAKGGIITEPVVGYGARSGESYLLGEAGPEEVRPLNGNNDNEIPLHVVVNFDSRIVGEWLTRATKNRTVLLHTGALI